MHRFSIWAPRPRSLRINVNGVALPMEGPDEQGWWRREVSSAGPGTDYGYLINNDGVCYPDPRSEWQPKGVHGLSRVYDQDAFAWTDRRFKAPPLKSGILYELHVGTFTEKGTLDAAIDRLSYLADLGFTHIELMPVASFAGNHGWGYDGVAIFAVHEPYGGPDALKRFVNAAHERGLAVLLDVVYNHFGPVGNYTGKFGPYLTDAHHTPWGGAVNLEGEWSHQVRRFFCDNALMWLRDFHLDGLRLDAVHAFIDRSAIHFLEQIVTKVALLEATLARELVIIAESDLNDPRVVMPREAGGFGTHAQWSDDFHHALFALLDDAPAAGYYADFGAIGHLAKAIEQTFVYDGIYSSYRKRMHGRPAGHLPRYRFLGYIQNHDQVGNRALGDRISHVTGIGRAKIAAAVVLLSPFIPLIFQGEEWAASSPFQYFADHDDPKLARLVSEGRKREFAAFGWNPDLIPDPEARQTFDRSKLVWTELKEPEHEEMLAWYRELIRLRRTTSCLNDGEPGHTRVIFDEGERWFQIERGMIMVTCNLAKSSREFPMPLGGRVILASRGGFHANEGQLILPTDTIAIIADSRQR